MFIERTKTFDKMIGLQQHLYMFKVEKIHLSGMIVIGGLRV